MKKNTKDFDFLVNCSICEHPFGSKGVFLVHEGEDRTIFHTSCANCFTDSLVFLNESSKGIAGMSMATDLDRSEVREKFIQKKITTDDIVDVYQMMHKTKGQLNDILKNS